jgi:hypothetical protein
MAISVFKNFAAATNLNWVISGFSNFDCWWPSRGASGQKIELTTAAIYFAAHPVHIAYISGTGEISFVQMLLDAILVQLTIQ